MMIFARYKENKNSASRARDAESEHGKNLATLLRVPAFLPSGGDGYGQDQNRKTQPNNCQQNVELHQHNSRKSYNSNFNLAESIAKLTAQKNRATNTPPNATIVSNRSNSAGIATDARATTPMSADIADSRSKWSALRWSNAMSCIMSYAKLGVKRIKDGWYARRKPLATALGAVVFAVLM